MADIAIIGAGPIGIELAVALKHGGVSVAHVEAGQIGATINWWPRGTRFFSSPERIEIAGVPMALPHQEKASREEYLAYLRGVCRQFDLAIHRFTRVAGIEKTNSGFQLATIRSAHGVGGPEELNADDAPASNGTCWKVNGIVLAIGDMHRPRMLNVPGEELPHVNHYFGDPHQYFGQRVLVVGGKNSAVEAALRLYRVGAQVTMSYRGREFDPKRVKYWLRPELEWLISKKRIEFHPGTLVRAIHHDRVELRSCQGADAVIDVPCDQVLLLTGYVQDPHLFEQVGIELEGDERAPRFDLKNMQSNVPKVYVAGTAAGGSQKRARLFIENSHVHVQRIVRSIAQRDVPWRADRDFGELEQ